MRELEALLDAATSPDEVLHAAQLVEQETAATSPERFVVTTLAQVADIMGVEEQTVRTWRLRNPPMPGQPGRWPLDKIAQWRLAQLEQTDPAAAKRRLDFELGEIRLERKRLELEQRKASVVQRDDVELWGQVTMGLLREGVMPLPDMIATTAPPEMSEFARQETERHCLGLLQNAQRRLAMDMIPSNTDPK